MSDTAVTREIVIDAKRSVFIFSSASDGTGEAAVTKVDISALPGAPEKVKINRIQYSVKGMNLLVHYDRSSEANVVVLNGDGVIVDPILDKGAGLTGDIKFTSTNAAAGGGYTVLLEVEKQT